MIGTPIPQNPEESWRQCSQMKKIDIDGLRRAYAG